MIQLVRNRFEQARSEESGFTTAELLGNAALGVVGLGLIWGVLQTDVLDAVKNFIIDQLTGGTP